MELIHVAILAQQWATEHWWMAFWLAFWALVLGYSLLRIVLVLPVRLAVRVLRAIKVLLRGWPPAHLDADGDWRPVPPPPGKLVSETMHQAGGLIIVERTYAPEVKS